MKFYQPSIIPLLLALPTMALGGALKVDASPAGEENLDIVFNEYQVVPDYLNSATATLSGNVQWNAGKSTASGVVDGFSDAAGGMASYNSDTCAVDPKDLGYVTVDLGRSMELDGVRIFLNPAGGNRRYCNVFLNVWDDGEDAPTKPFEPETLAPTNPPTSAPTDPPTPVPTTSKPTMPLKPTLPPHGPNAQPGTCHICDPNDDPDLCEYTSISTTCPDTHPLCLSYVTNHDDSTRDVVRRCGTVQECYADWYKTTSDNADCTDFNPTAILRKVFHCTFCCTTPNCNADIRPEFATLWTLDRRLSDQDSNVYNSGYNHEYGPVVTADGLDIPIAPAKKVRYIRLWAGHNSVDNEAGIYEIQPLVRSSVSVESNDGIQADGGPETIDFGGLDFASDSALLPPPPPPPPPPKATSVPNGSTSGSGAAKGTQTGQGAKQSHGLKGATPGSSSGSSGKGNKSAVSKGDPHFKTFAGKKFDFHGGCDLVLLQHPNFSNKLGLDINIRTKINSWWSSIDSAVIRIGNDKLEVTGGTGGGKYWINGEPGKTLEHEEHRFALSGFMVHVKQSGPQQKQYRVDLGYRNAISFDTYKAFVSANVNVKYDAHLSGSRGLMGSYPDGKNVARDGLTIMEDPISFGKEWQVLASEPMLFHNVEGPQHPEACAMPSTAQAAVERRTQRRLGEAGMTQEDAEVACAHADPEEKDACIFDVLATQDKGMAGSY